MDTKRFQTSSYRQQINAARNYQRCARPKPFTPGQKFLYYLGLGTILNRVIAVLILAALVYLTYFAKFLMFKDPQIQGADQPATQEVLSFFDSYKHTYLYHFLPQKNFVFFQPSRFTGYLLSNDYKIASVTEIKRKFPNEITIVVNQRVPVFAVQSGTQYFILNSDGNISTTTDQAGAAAYPLVLDSADEQLSQGESFVQNQTFNYLTYLQNNFKNKTGIDLDHYEIPGRGADQLIVYTKKGFKIMFSTKSDPGTFVDRFAKLWAQFTPDQQNTLAYADLRFDLNAYACFKGSACAK